jgi:hypothetical protein
MYEIFSRIIYRQPLPIADQKSQVELISPCKRWKWSLKLLKAVVEQGLINNSDLSIIDVMLDAL